MRKPLPKTTLRGFNVDSIDVMVVCAFELHAVELRAPHQGVNQPPALARETVRDDFIHHIGR